MVDTIQQRGKSLDYQQDCPGVCRAFPDGGAKRDYENYIDHESHFMDELTHLAQSGSSMSGWKRRMLLAQSLSPTRRSVIADLYRHLQASEWTQQIPKRPPSHSRVGKAPLTTSRTNFSIAMSYYSPFRDLQGIAPPSVTHFVGKLPSRMAIAMKPLVIELLF